MVRTPTNIDQAIGELTASAQSVTVSAILPVYIRIAGYTTLCDDAIIAFERAIEKIRDDEATSLAQKLRNDYWCDKLGGRKNGEGVCVTCPGCGGLRIEERNAKCLKHGNCATPPKAIRAKPKPKAVKVKKRRVLKSVTGAFNVACRWRSFELNDFFSKQGKLRRRTPAAQTGLSLRWIHMDHRPAEPIYEPFSPCITTPSVSHSKNSLVACISRYISHKSRHGNPQLQIYTATSAHHNPRIHSHSFNDSLMETFKYN